MARRVVLWMLLALAAPSVLVGARRLLDDDPEVAGKPTLTAEEVASLVGVWVADRPEEGARLDGSLFELEVAKALKAAHDDGSEVDFDEVLRASLTDSDSVPVFTVVIPAVDPASGIWAGFRLFKPNTNSSATGADQPGFIITDVKRLVGFAAPDGAGGVRWEASENIDNAWHYGHLPANSTLMDFRRLEGEEVWSKDGSRTVDGQATFYGRFTKASPEEAEAALEVVRNALPLKKVVEGGKVVS